MQYSTLQVDVGTLGILSRPRTGTSTTTNGGADAKEFATAGEPTLLCTSIPRVQSKYLRSTSSGDSSEQSSRTYISYMACSPALSIGTTTYHTCSEGTRKPV